MGRACGRRAAELKLHSRQTQQDDVRQTREENDANHVSSPASQPTNNPEHTALVKTLTLMEARGKAEPDWDDWSLTRGLDREC